MMMIIIIIIILFYVSSPSVNGVRYTTKNNTTINC